ncbi:MAG: Hint domain-containing protein [Pseudomonadota bacterium]
MTPFNASPASFTDFSGNDGFTLDLDELDNSLSIQVNGVEVFVGGPAGSEHELEFQSNQTETVEFADGANFGSGGIENIWMLSNSTPAPVVKIVVTPDGNVSVFAIRSDNGALEELVLTNGLTVNTANIAAAWVPGGPNSVTLDQQTTGPTVIEGVFNENEDFTGAPCFTKGTLILCASGTEKPIEELRKGDFVQTQDHGVQPIRWIGHQSLDMIELTINPKLKPVKISADALGTGFPRTDLVVSPQHRILVRSEIARRIFGTLEILVPAKKLIGLKGVDVVNPDAFVEYFHILMDDHEIIWANGTPTETLLTGAQAMASFSKGARNEIKSLFPQIFEPGFLPVPARKIPTKGTQVTKLVSRHVRNKKSMLERT